MKISVEPFGVLPDGRQAMLYKLENNSGMTAEITNFGGVVYRLMVPDKNGQQADVVLGHPNFDAYLTNPGYFGALVGRNCNRIADAVVEIAGKTYDLDKNDGANNLHSGKGTLSFQLLSAEARTVGNQPVLLLTTTLAHLSDGFPGNITITIAYALTDDNTLMIDYRGVSDKETVINMTNHSYFNLAGHASGNVYNQLLQLDAPFFNPGNDQCMPNGEILNVAGTPFDFRTARAIGKDINSNDPQLTQYGGYDHNMILSGTNYRVIGSVADPGSGRVMEISTNLPAVQFYSGNGISNGCPGKDGAVYNPHSGFCLETQFAPNAVNMPWLASPIFGEGEECVTTTAYHFTTI